ncbi:MULTISPECIES: heavy-metal-associated domain-containing protein [Enterococcus]|uniref:heavy-metal-associated domain-containing protein n=1 Tax=Enterococcus TaxID=1350 RepID=UPI00039E18A7|nr:MULTISPECIES: cation transporter [Enterococcus]KFO16545.1 metal-binding protein [Enterococcus faecium UC7267]KGK77260.1 metal-binding protein [Enterococcus faecium]MBT9719792.1 metal-binding protein [Enterococcus durans]MCR9049799.1 cation transporter [Enterococcus faecium]PQF18181.1 metal-binding protein [Enterococcus faecium]
MSKAVITLEPLACPSCLKKIESAVRELNGIDHNNVKGVFNASKIRVDFDENMLTVEDVEKAIENLGYPVIKSKVKIA